MYPVHLLFYLRCILKLKEVRRSKTPVHIRRLCNCIIAYPSRRNVKSAPRQHHPASSTLSRVILFTFSIQAGMSPTGSATAGRSCQVILLWSICLPKHPEMRPFFMLFIITTGPFIHIVRQVLLFSVVLCLGPHRIGFVCLAVKVTCAAYSGSATVTKLGAQPPQDCYHQHNLQRYITAAIDALPHFQIRPSVCFSPSHSSPSPPSLNFTRVCFIIS